MKLQLRETILRRLEDGPVGRKMLAQAEAEAKAERISVQSQLRDLTEQFLAERERLVTTLDGSTAKVEAARAALVDAEAKMAAASAALRTRTHAYDIDKSRLERRLAETAPDELMRAFQEEMTALWSTVRDQRETLVGPKSVNGQPAWVTNNFASVEAALEAIRDAREGARALAVSATVTDFEGELSALRSSIPAVEPPKPPRGARLGDETREQAVERRAVAL